jgi:hypothetical protein
VPKVPIGSEFAVDGVTVFSNYDKSHTPHSKLAFHLVRMVLDYLSRIPKSIPQFQQSQKVTERPFTVISN